MRPMCLLPLVVVLAGCTSGDVDDPIDTGVDETGGAADDETGETDTDWSWHTDEDDGTDPPTVAWSFTFVLDDDGDLRTAAAPIEGATVTADSGADTFTATTDAAGRAVLHESFRDLKPPFWVTAQKDIEVGGETIRIASSIRIEDTSSEDFGVVFVMDGGFESDDEGPPTADTRLSGTVRNVPIVPAGYQLDVVAKREGTEDQQLTLLTGPTDGPAGDVPFAMSGLAPGDYWVYAGIAREAGVGDVAWGWDYEAIAVSDGRVRVNADQDNATDSVDFAARGIPFASKEVSASGWASGGVGPVFDVLVAKDGDEFPIGVHGAIDPGAWTVPSSLSLADGAPEGFDVSNSFATWAGDDPDWQQLRDVPVADAGPLDFALPGRLTIDRPFHGASARAADLATSELAWSGDATGLGLTTVVLSGEPDLAGVDATAWLILLPGDATTMTLPATERPMLGAGGFELEVTRHAVADGTTALGVDAFAGPNAHEQLGRLLPVGRSADSRATAGLELR